jgi:hypothetical protein
MYNINHIQAETPWQMLPESSEFEYENDGLEF